ncbi:hypothetical protein SEA_RYADEL_114 [Mycobacterium phage Ryadel]|uniref:Uncharacterized protein n=1 Tax=Mycobacterium phage Ryadel TaxID=2283292 RepID=A0A345MF80_9CAUD|nr:hypothetical protein KNU03_gp114 [Mycobacterium phage Ryadel]AXH69211.1 hypothetical protein SEA_RYADEL_114 [Mycobacterium phage Ryadel]
MTNTEVVDAQDPNEVLYSFEASSMPRRGDVCGIETSFARCSVASG